MVNIMRRRIVKKVMVDGIYSAFSEGVGRSFIVFEVDHASHRISMDYEGRHIGIGTLYNLLLSDPDLREEMKWGIQAKRVNPAKVFMHEGMSGCRDYELRFYDCNPEFISYFKGRMAASLHISCFECVEPRFEIWSGDLAAILYAVWPFAFSSNAAFRVYNGERILIKRSTCIKYINPTANYDSTALDVVGMKEQCASFSTPDGMNLRETFKRVPRRPRAIRRAITFPEIETPEPVEETCE